MGFLCIIYTNIMGRKVICVDNMYKAILAMSKTDEALDKTVAYLAGHLTFLRPNEQVLLCYPDRKKGSIGWLFAQAIQRRGAAALWLNADRRWKSLLWQAFSSRASVIIGQPLIILGLAKLAKYKHTPLYIRHAVTAGYPCPDWMLSAITRGLDCEVWGCFDPGGIVAGFSCPDSQGVHLRIEEYGFSVAEATGELILSTKSEPMLSFPTGAVGTVVNVPCPCGGEEPRLLNISATAEDDPDLDEFRSMLQNWSSILDCKVQRGQYGLEMELVVFPGEKLPKLPTCAKQTIRCWDPEEDVPFGMDFRWKIPDFSGEYH